MIFPYQRDAYNELARTMSAHLLASKYEIKPRPRLSRLIIGPTGTGKSFIAKHAAKAAGWPVWSVNVSGWIIAGARQEPTWKHLLDWAVMLDDKQPGLIVLDEVDKVWSAESWSQHLRAELYSLIDGSVPPSVTEYELDGRRWNMQELEQILSRHLIVACGAFQENLGSEKIGFQGKPDEPTPNELAKHLQRELVNRFHGAVIQLPRLTRKDYIDMLLAMESTLPKQIYDRVTRLSASRIDDAVRDQSGARFAECLVSDVLLDMAESRGVWKHLMEHQKSIDDEADQGTTREDLIKEAIRRAEEL